MRLLFMTPPLVEQNHGAFAFPIKLRTNALRRTLNIESWVYPDHMWNLCRLGNYVEWQTRSFVTAAALCNSLAEFAVVLVLSVVADLHLPGREGSTFGSGRQHL